MVYAREFDGEAHNFGVSGLDEGTLIMYDAETRSRWSQLVGKAVSGQMQGRQLEKLPSTMTTWVRWRALHPDTTVYVKRSIPYGAHFTADAFAGVASAEPGPLENEDLVIGVEGHVEARAYLARYMAREGRLLNDELEDAPIVVFLSEDLATARIYDRRLEDRTLTLELAPGDSMRDVETGSTWDPVSGTAVAGPLEGKQLQPLVSTYSLWFAWRKYRPDTSLHGASMADADDPPAS